MAVVGSMYARVVGWLAGRRWQKGIESSAINDGGQASSILVPWSSIVSMIFKIMHHHKMGALSATSAHLIAGMFFVLALSGCNNVSTTRIDARDNTVSLGQLRMAYNFDHEKNAALPHTGNAIELDVTKTKGSDIQSLSSSQLPITLGNTTFYGPQQLKNEFDFTYYELSWRNRLFIENKIVMEISVGAGYSLVDLKTSSASQNAVDRVQSSGVRGGLGLIYLLSPSSSIQARGSAYYAPLQIRAADSIARVELVYAKAFFDNFRLRVGYSAWQVYGHSLNALSLPNSDFKLDFSGPIAALDFEF